MSKPKAAATAGLARARGRKRASDLNFGLIAVAGDESITHELRLMLASRHAKLYVAHVPALSEGPPAGPHGAIGDIVSAAKWLALGQPLSAIAYAGTLTTIAMGEERIGRPLEEARPGIPWTTPITASLAGLAPSSAPGGSFCSAPIPSPVIGSWPPISGAAASRSSKMPAWMWATMAGKRRCRKPSCAGA